MIVVFEAKHYIQFTDEGSESSINHSDYHLLYTPTSPSTRVPYIERA